MPLAVPEQKWGKGIDRHMALQEALGFTFIALLIKLDEPLDQWSTTGGSGPAHWL